MVVETKSERFTMLIRPSLKAEIEAAASVRGISSAQIVTRAVVEYLEKLRVREGR